MMTPRICILVLVLLIHETHTERLRRQAFNFNNPPPGAGGSSTNGSSNDTGSKVPNGDDGETVPVVDNTDSFDFSSLFSDTDSGDTGNDGGNPVPDIATATPLETENDQDSTDGVPVIPVPFIPLPSLGASKSDPGPQCSFDLCQLSACSENETCRMLSDCSASVCEEQSLPVKNDPGEPDCQFNFCDLMDVCDKSMKCQMTPDCSAQCVNKSTNLPPIGTNPQSTAAPGNDFITHDDSERTCGDSSLIKCRHGKCKDGGCICEDGWSGTLCSEQCTLTCEHGSCLAINNKMICNCEYQYEGKLCDQLIPDPEEKAQLMYGLLGGALGLTLLVAFIVPYVLWRMRNILILKLVYHFKEYEDKDGKLYDAYVSMTSTPKAEKFVYESLCPKLEKQGFKLFLHARDCPVGEVMSEVILDALAQSRRTIMIVTPDYLCNEWSRFEYLIAQHETLKLHQRIIPVILEDIDQKQVSMDKSLKHILDSIKCLRYPLAKSEVICRLASVSISVGEEMVSPTNSESPLASAQSKAIKKYENRVDKFWKRLELTMPKKKKEEDQSHLSGNRFANGQVKGEKALDQSQKMKTVQLTFEDTIKSSPLDFMKKNYKKNSYDLGSNYLDIDLADVFQKDQNIKPLPIESLNSSEKFRHPNGVEFHEIQLEADV